MKKAMGQVFGEIDERKTAAEKLQRLRQTRSVTEYITEFQMITSNLDWDDEALEDKFLEGLKPEIRKALIYYPTEPRNVEELFERAQRLIGSYGDNEIVPANEGITDTLEQGFLRKNRHGELTETATSR